MTCTGGLIFEGQCDSNVPSGKKLSGDLEVENFLLQGLEDTGPTYYRLNLAWQRQDDGDDGASPSYQPTYQPSCMWYVTPELELQDGPRTLCHHAPAPCFAELVIEPE